MDDSTLTVVYTSVVTGTAVVFVSVVGCVDVTTGNDVCDTGRAVLVDVDVSDDVPVTSSKVVVAVVGWLACEASRPSFGVLVVVDKGVLAVVNSFSVTVSVVLVVQLFE